MLARSIVPRVIAHRGASATHPENTRAAFDAAVGAGCDGVELDLQLSRDGVPLVYHDRTLRKIGGGVRSVGQATSTDVLRLDAGGWFASRYAGERVPVLDDVLERYGGRLWLLLELKVRRDDKQAGVHRRLAEVVVRSLRTRKVTRRVMILCFDFETLQLVSERAPDIPTVLNLEAPRRMTTSLRRSIERVSALSIDIRTISVDIVRATHDAGRPVLTYTCNGPLTLRRALDAGVEGVMTDRPEWLRRALSETGGRGRVD